MKRLLGLVLFTAALSLGALAQKHSEVDIPAPVKEAFARQFPGTAPRWEKLGDQYGAHFKHRRQEMSAVYTGDGTLSETEEEIKVAQLPRPVVDYVAQHFRGAKITEATKITKANGEINYKACTKGSNMFFDASCTYLTEKGQPVTKFQRQ